MNIKYTFILLFAMFGCKNNNYTCYLFKSDTNENALRVNLNNNANIGGYTFTNRYIGCNWLQIILLDPRRVHNVYYGTKYSCKTFENFPFTTIGKPDSIDHIKAEDWVDKHKYEYENIRLKEINNKNYVTILYPYNGLGIKHESNFNSDSLKIAVTSFIFDYKKEFFKDAEKIHYDFISQLDFIKYNTHK